MNSSIITPQGCSAVQRPHFIGFKEIVLPEPGGAVIQMMGLVRARSSSRNNRARGTIFGNLGGVSLLGSGRFRPEVGGSIFFDMA